MLIIVLYLLIYQPLRAIYVGLYGEDNDDGAQRLREEVFSERNIQHFQEPSVFAIF